MRPEFVVPGLDGSPQRVTHRGCRPLCTTPFAVCRSGRRIMDDKSSWCWMQATIPPPPTYKIGALPNELIQHIGLRFAAEEPVCKLRALIKNFLVHVSIDHSLGFFISMFTGVTVYVVDADTHDPGGFAAGDRNTVIIGSGFVL